VVAYKSKIQIKERQPLVGHVYYVSQADKKKYIDSGKAPTLKD
jgi:hypothetical protein